MLCNATIRFAEGSYVILFYEDEEADAGYVIGSLFYTDTEGVAHEYPIRLDTESEDDDGGGGED